MAGWAKRRGAAARAMLVLLLAACSPGPGPVATRAATGGVGGGWGAGPAEAPARGNAGMAGDILDLAFQMEGGQPIARLSRFEGPVRVAVEGPAPPTLGPDLDALLGRMRAEAGLDIRRARPGEAAEVTVVAVPAAALAAAVPGAACFVVPNASSWDEFRRGGAALDWTRVAERTRAGVFVPADAAPQELRDCLHEELAQAMGPLNDLYRLPDSVFNDDNIQGTLTGFDMLALRAIHDPALRSGMTRDEVGARLPAILARLNPRGERDGGALPPTSRAWADRIEVALAPDRPEPERQAAARAAAAMARGEATREGFALYALGRLQAATDPGAALAAFEAADAAYGRSGLTAIHRAHVQVQLAAFALADGDAGRVLDLTASAIPVAARAENAALLGTLLMFRAEAAWATGDEREAERLRLDGLGWARYGFGGEAAAEARLAEVRALSPWRATGDVP